jgi:hypothetical protein
MPFCTVTEKALLGQELGDTSPTIPGTHYAGLLIASTWAASTSYSTGVYVIPTTFGSLTGSVGRVFKCTTGGTSSSSQPTWPTTPGGTVTDGTVTWTEVSTLFAAGTFTGAEPSGGGYARVGITNNTTNWPTPTGGNPAQVQNANVIAWPTTTASWGQIVGTVAFDALTAGNARWWGLLASASTVATSVGVAPQISATQLTVTLT